jgi:hypothetical protein
MQRTATSHTGCGKVSIGYKITIVQPPDHNILDEITRIPLDTVFKTNMWNHDIVFLLAPSLAVYKELLQKQKACLEGCGEFSL